MSWLELEQENPFPLELVDALQNPKHVGNLFPKAGLRHCKGLAKRPRQAIEYQLLVDESNSLIEEISWHAYGPAILLALAELVAAKLEKASIRQAPLQAIELLEKHLQISEAAIATNIICAALEKAAETCLDICPLTPTVNCQSDWNLLDNTGKKSLLEKVLERDIRPALRLDGGDIQIKRLQGNKLTINYGGVCLDCPLAFSSTLHYVQQTLSRSIGEELILDIE